MLPWIRIHPLLIGACSLLCVVCKQSEPEVQIGHWVKRSPFKAHPRSGAFVFTVDNSAFVGLGFYNGEFKGYFADCHVYNTDSAYWERIADFPGTPRERAVSFSVNGKGYVGTGYNMDSSTTRLRDFWEYNPVTNRWKRVRDFPGSARFNAVAFASKDYGYVGTGFDGTEKADFYRYDPASDSWTEIKGFPGPARQKASSFTIDSNVYLLGGFYRGDLDLWQFDLKSETWANITPSQESKQTNDFKAAVSRSDAAAFSIDGKGYIALGFNGQFLKTGYQFDPVAQTWMRIADSERPARGESVSFTLNNRAFITTGRNDAMWFDFMDEYSSN